jgi:hypothetical protein
MPDLICAAHMPITNSFAATSMYLQQKTKISGRDRRWPRPQCQEDNQHGASTVRDGTVHTLTVT